MNQDVAGQLESLLSEPLEQIIRRVANRVAIIRAPEAKLALYGAGTMGRYVLARLRVAGVEPALFIDDTSALHGSRVDGVEVVSLEHVAMDSTVGLVVAVTILNPLLPYVRARQQLMNAIDAHVVSMFELGWAYPEHLLPLGALDVPVNTLYEGERIKEAAHAFSDAESCRQFLAHMRFRLLLDFDSLPVAAPHAYFPADVVGQLPQNLCFVDCGAYDGDSIGEFLVACRDRFDAIVAFEPDPQNFARLRAYVDVLPAAVRTQIRLLPFAVGARSSTIRFNATGNMSAAASERGESAVQLVRIDDAVDLRGAPVFLKLDVEGSEQEALEGATRLITAQATTLAVSVYHRPSDLWELPLLLRELCPASRIYLRTHGHDGTDAVCYAVPRRT